jgi:DNA replication factor GINS
MSSSSGQQSNGNINVDETKSRGNRNNNSDDLTLKSIYKLLKSEIEIPSLQVMEFDTFHKIAAILADLETQEYEEIEAKIRDRMVNLLANSARLLLEARQHKILAKNDVLDYSKLTDEEKYILDGERESYKRISGVLTAMIKGRQKILESISERMRRRQIIVRFIKPIDKFIGVDLNKYGPFQPEDVASLPFENARSLIENTVAIEVQIEI